MKKLLVLLSVGIIAIGLAGCSSTSSATKNTSHTISSHKTVVALKKADLQSYFSKSDNTTAKAINAYLDNYENKSSNQAATEQIENAASDLASQNKLLGKTSTNKKLAAKIVRMNNANISIFKNIMMTGGNTEKGNKASKLRATLSNELKSDLNVSNTKSYTTAVQRWDSLEATAPRTTSNSVITPDYTIKITKTDTTSDFDGGTDIVVYYEFTNNSSDKNIEPESEFMNGDMTQENDTSIVTLDTGIPNDSDAFDSLEEASQQQVKPGATVQCAITYTLDNTGNPVKYVAKDDDTNKIGTITLQLNQ